MAAANSYKTIVKPTTGEFKDRGSKFIGYAFPILRVEDFKNCLNEVKKEHPKARHHCFAYRIGTDGNNFRAGDDGEPSGSAGRPILGQIDSFELTNVLVVVVRYFGGTLLGVPGLINAYKTATALALEVAEVVEKPILMQYRLQFDYTQMNDVLKILKYHDVDIIKQDLQLFCVVEIGIAKERHEKIIEKIADLRTVEIEKLF